jgi:hypothetical protein
MGIIDGRPHPECLRRATVNRIFEQADDRRGLRLCSAFGARARQIGSFAVAAAALFDTVREHEPRLRHCQHSGLQPRIRKPLRRGEAVSGVLAIFFVSVHGHTHATLSFCANVASDDGWLESLFDIVSATSDMIAAKQRGRISADRSLRQTGPCSPYARVVRPICGPHQNRI